MAPDAAARKRTARNRREENGNRKRGSESVRLSVSVFVKVRYHWYSKISVYVSGCTLPW